MLIPYSRFDIAGRATSHHTALASDQMPTEGRRVPTLGRPVIQDGVLNINIPAQIDGHGRGNCDSTPFGFALVALQRLGRYGLSWGSRLTDANYPVMSSVVDEGTPCSPPHHFFCEARTSTCTSTDGRASNCQNCARPADPSIK